jgi:serine/threonine-protein kinase HipA
VLDRICELGAQVHKERRRKGPELVQREPLVQGLKTMVPTLERIATDGETMGLEPELLQHLRPGILARAQEMAALS